jgi:hypothetical protein
MEAVDDPREQAEVRAFGANLSQMCHLHEALALAMAPKQPRGSAAAALSLERASTALLQVRRLLSTLRPVGCSRYLALATCCLLLIHTTTRAS